MDAQRDKVADGSLDSGYKAIAGWRTPIQQHVRDTQSTRIETSRVERGEENQERKGGDTTAEAVERGDLKGVICPRRSDDREAVGHQIDGERMDRSTSCARATRPEERLVSPGGVSGNSPGQVEGRMRGWRDHERH
ncbi:hypothetical protein F1880_005781 [Penicillium rolfsii]|nr:hypothetical protein F1880_005781 [Penicillium rolfsii]